METQQLYILTGAFLFLIGLGIIFTKRNVIMILIGIEFVLNAANLNLIAFNALGKENDGKVMSLMIMLVAVCEAALALGIVIAAVRHFGSSDLDKLKSPEQL